MAGVKLCPSVVFIEQGCRVSICLEMAVPISDICFATCAAFWNCIGSGLEMRLDGISHVKMIT